MPLFYATLYTSLALLPGQGLSCYAIHAPIITFLEYHNLALEGEGGSNLVAGLVELVGIEG